MCASCQGTRFETHASQGVGRIESVAVVHHAVHPALKDAVPYIVVLVELPGAGNIRMVGNLLGDGEQPVEIGSEVEPVFEDHEGDKPYTLVQWRTTG